MTRIRVKTPSDKTDLHDDLDAQVISAAKPLESEPVTFGDDVYDPRSGSERFPMPEDLPTVVVPDEGRNS